MVNVKFKQINLGSSIKVTTHSKLWRKEGINYSTYTLANGAPVSEKCEE